MGASAAAVLDGGGGGGLLCGLDLIGRAARDDAGCRHQKRDPSSAHQKSCSDVGVITNPCSPTWHAVIPLSSTAHIASPLTVFSLCIGGSAGGGSFTADA